ncbi:uncharacterized protein [Asterias amurensis]|uniref:uncharacterized protein n=1 Tax=Asterias amurensis TaxID=7602 RepID=UPI003AB75B5E
MTLARASKRLVLSIVAMMMTMPVPTHSQEDWCPIEQGYEPVVTNPDADLIIALMLELHDAGDINADECDFNKPANPAGEQAKLVAETAINNWPNSITVASGISFGLEIYDTCLSLNVGRFGASRYLNGRYRSLYSNTSVECTNSTLRLGVVGFESSSLTGPLSMVLQPLDIPVIDFTSTADGLSDTTKYPNFFRTVPPDHTTVQVLTAVMKSFGWTYAKMIHNGNEFGLSGERALLTAALQPDGGFCLSESIVINRRETSDEVYDDIVNQCVQQNIKVFILWTSSFNVIRLFKAIDRIGGAAHDIQLVTTDTIHYVSFNDLSDGEKAVARGIIAVSPFVKSEAFKAWLAKFHPSIDFTFLPSVLLVDSIHAYLQAFSLAHLEKCGGLSASCDVLASIQGSEFVQYVKRVNFTGVSGGRVAFDENGDPLQSFYEILQYKSTVIADGYSLQVVGEWDATTGLTLNKSQMEFYGEIGLLVQPPMSTCEEGACTDLRCRGGFPKFVIEALFDLHGSGCDTLRENRFTQVQAALFALNKINQDSNILPGVHLSMTVSDICGSVEDAGRVVFQKIKDWSFGGGFARQNGETYLMGMLHSGSNGKAIEESRTLQIVDVPLLASSATSPALSDSEEFPNFLRTVPSDTKQTLAMSEILVSLGLKYVQVINSRGAYGEGGALAFGDAAKKNGVCITNSATVDSNTNYGMLLSNLMAKPDARVLVLFVTDSDARGLFQEMVDRSVEPGYFQIIASDTWSTRADFIPGLESVAVGALTVTFKSSPIPAFEEFFLTMTPMNQDGSNPFFNEFWSQKFQCDLPSGNTQYGKNCTGSEILTSNDVSSLGMENIINVVFVYSMALSNLINKTCPDGTICDAVADVEPGQWLQYLHDVDFTSPVGSRKLVSFDENGDGAGLFAVYQLIQETSEYKFKEVGQWSDDGGLTINKNEITYVSQDDSIDNSSSCREKSEFVIEALFDLYGIGCIHLPQFTLLQTEAIRFAVETINQNPDLLPQLHLSVPLTAICLTTEDAGRVAFQMLKGWDFDGGFPTNDESYLMGVLHTGSSGTAIEVSKTLQIVDLPIVSNLATSPALSDKEQFGNFLRMVPSDTKQATLITEVLARLGLMNVQVVNSIGAYGEGGAKAIKDASKKVGVCVAKSYTVDSNSDYIRLVSNLMAVWDARVLVLFLYDNQIKALLQEMVNRNVEPGYFQIIGSDTWGTRSDFITGLEAPAVGALTVNFKSSFIPTFEDYLLSRTPQDDNYNPFFNEFWSQKFQCDLPGGNNNYGVSCTGSEVLLSSEITSLGMEDLINSVYVYATALSDVINDTCPNGKICDAVADVEPWQWLQYLQDVEFTSPVGSEKSVGFDENGDGAGFFAVYQFITETNGTYLYKEVGEWSEDVGLTLMKEEISYVSQDSNSSICKQKSEFVLEGLFELHRAGEECSSLRQITVFKTEAARFAVEAINQNPDLLPQIHLSVPLTAICGTPEDAGRVAFQMLKGWDFDGGFPTNNESYLLGVLHTGSSGKAIEQSKVLQIVDVPMISNLATSPALSDKEQFGNFLRMVPSDTKQATLITEVLASLGLTYIQIVNSKGPYGEGGAMAIKEAGGKVGVCVANSYTVDSNTDYDTLMGNLLAKSDARVLVLFLEDDHAIALFQEMVNRNVEPGYFQIIGSDIWGTRSDVIPGLEALAVGALTVFFKSFPIPMFYDYLLRRTPQDDDSNPFFNEFWEEKFKCNLPGGSTKYGVSCTGSEVLSQSDVPSLGYEDLINSIYVYATALSGVINDTCPNGKICDAIADVEPEQWFQYLQDVNFTSPVGSEKSVSFDENGDGPALFAVYQLTETNGMYSFIEVGTWDELNGLSNLTDGLIDPMLMSICTGLCAECNPEPTNNEHKYLRIPGDLDILVILQLSERGEGLTCGPPLPEKALVIESLLYTLDQVNNDSLLLPGVQLGVTIVDSCGNLLIAERELVGVLGGFTQLESSGPTLALLGAVNPDVAQEVSEDVSSPNKIPLVSNSATSTELGDAQEYPYVLRTSAPFSSQAEAVAQILQEFSWRYVAVVYSNTPYGMENYMEFTRSSSGSRVCIAGEHQINDETDYEELIKELGSDSDLYVIVAFVEASHARKLLLADEFVRNKRFLWVGTDTWDSPSVVNRLEEPAGGMLLVTNRKPDLPDLQDYFAQLDFEAANKRDPFLGEYLKRNDNCDPSATGCQFSEMVRKSIQELSVEISSLVNALHVIAQGASWLHDDKCGSLTEGLCDAFLVADPEDMVAKMQQVTLEYGAGGEPFFFNDRSAPADYSIKNFQYDGLSWQFVIVGDYQDGKLTLEETDVNLYNPASDNFQKVPSSCRCMNPVASYTLTNWVWSDHGLWSVIVLIVAGVFAVVALAVVFLFMNKRFSYIVQGASFSLSLWLLFGIVLMYLLNIVYVFDANPAICGIRRFGTSFVYCVVYSAMLAKSIRLNRFSRKDPREDLNFAGSWSQTLLFLAFLLPEVFLVGEWLILVPSAALLNENSEGSCGVNLLQPSCAFSPSDLTITMFYACFLVLVTFLSSVGSINAPNFQHEGTSLYLSSMFSALILVSWTCVYNLAKPVYSLAAIPIGLTADATVILILMFYPKVKSLCRNKSEANERVEFKKHQDKMIHVYDNQEVHVEVASAIEDEDTHF